MKRYMMRSSGYAPMPEIAVVEAKPDGSGQTVALFWSVKRARQYILFMNKNAQKKGN